MDEAIGLRCLNLFIAIGIPDTLRDQHQHPPALRQLAIR